MEENDYITVIPAYDQATAAKECKGLFTLIGPEWMDTSPDPIGFIPIQVEVPRYGWSYDIIEEAWTGYWQYTLGTGPEPGRWWIPQFIGAGKDLYEMFDDWMRAHYKVGVVRGIPEAFVDQEIKEQLYWSSLIPRRIVASACDICAKPGTWTLTTSMLLWNLSSGGHVKRWDPQLPSGAIKKAAQESHTIDLDTYDKRCEEQWQWTRKGLSDDDESKKCKTLFELDDADSVWAEQIRKEIAEEFVGTAHIGHKTLWYPPDWVMDRITYQINAKCEQLDEIYPRRGPMFYMAGPAMDAWQAALSVQMRGLQFDGKVVQVAS